MSDKTNPILHLTGAIEQEALKLSDIQQSRFDLRMSGVAPIFNVSEDDITQRLNENEEFHRKQLKQLLHILLVQVDMENEAFMILQGDRANELRRYPHQTK